ncbi:MAG: molybdopterin molybdenumtransferase MoeA [Dehalococcoidia bacterium]|nr:MAG: molybdopterin molybdenumtransferase MoeA [Dehalococcoidia bacterium]
MISVEQALEKILGFVDILNDEERSILDCLGQVLAEDIYSNIDVPPLDNTAMDGYAVQSRDTHRASRESPRFLRVTDTVAAGSISRFKLEPGTAIRIMTGAAIPKGADSVVKFEDTDEAHRKGSATEIGILVEVEPGKDIRRAGEDIAKGSLVLRRGVIIRPSEVGVLASLGRSVVRVIRRPMVAILATGDELVDINQPLPAGKIYNSNTYSLAALVRRYGGIPKLLGIALDSEESVVTGLSHGLDADMLITTGGVSVGDYDVVKDVLAKQGEIDFWTVRMKPGKPLAFGMIRGRDPAGGIKNIPHLGLPGNPVSSMITFELFVRPAVLKMMGKKNLTKPTVEAVIEEPMVNNDGRRIFARAVVEKRNGQYFARLTGPQGSGILTSMTLANGLVIVPEDKPGVKKGDTVQVMMLDWSEE